MAVTGLPATSPAEAGSKDTGSTSTAAAATSSAEARSIHIGPNSLAATLAEGGQSAAQAAAMASIATPMRTAIDGMGASVEPVPTLDSARPTHRMLARRQVAAPTRFDEHMMQPLRCRTTGKRRRERSEREGSHKAEGGEEESGGESEEEEGEEGGEEESGEKEGGEEEKQKILYRRVMLIRVNPPERYRL